MINIDKRPFRADGGDISTGRLKEIADNPYGDEEKCRLAKRMLALLDEVEVATDACNGWQIKFAEADERLEAAEKRIAELTVENEYIRKRFKESDLLFGKNLLVMQAAIIEWQGTGDAKKGLAWIYNTLFGPGELPDEEEKDAQAYFDRKYAPLDEELMNLHRWFWEQREAERAAAAGKGE